MFKHIANDCGCPDSKGNSKRNYPTIEEAEDQTEFILEDRGVHLNVYPCPQGSGFHLTSKQEQY